MCGLAMWKSTITAPSGRTTGLLFVVLVQRSRGGKAAGSMPASRSPEA